ncbi:uncharacterized protein L3040_000404 [Drepanopeziza brunnea f. sp. 'multigermtubi']|uniref:uncharacterized protein n=1 Tax=Drepanopeziza brunnea f. sp. 'multigermtubi' TaxID=698441 RepID=UPI0023877E42|nr:hypothetical protein L3040_000404 [Drepanopeziza brunnea f. sp. 'multigermtubi']
MPRSKTFVAILLALSFLFSEAQGFLGFHQQRQVIGYTTVPEEMAKRINEKHKPYIVESNYHPPLGPGFYMVNDPHSWEGGKGSWYCATVAKKKQMERISKVFIPKLYQKLDWDGGKRQNLWGGDEEVIENYVKIAVADGYSRESVK